MRIVYTERKDREEGGEEMYKEIRLNKSGVKRIELTTEYEKDRKYNRWELSLRSKTYKVKKRYPYEENRLIFGLIWIEIRFVW